MRGKRWHWGYAPNPGLSLGFGWGAIESGWEISSSFGYLSKEWYLRMLVVGWGYDDETPFSLLPRTFRTKKYGSRYVCWAGFFLHWHSFDIRRYP